MHTISTSMHWHRSESQAHFISLFCLDMLQKAINFNIPLAIYNNIFETFYDMILFVIFAPK